MHRFMRQASVLFANLVILAWVTSVFAAPNPIEVAAEIDKLLLEEIELSKEETSPLVDDSAFARRVYLDLVGKIPTRKELQAFLDNESKGKRKKLVNTLLAREEFGKNQARYWRDVILSRRLEDRAFSAEEPLLRDLAKWINTGRPWDAIAREFITAEGKVDDNGGTAIILAQDGRAEEVAAEVSRIFLGIQIQCAQCHDHPWDAWEREQFHELAAFFPRIGVRPEPKSRPPSFTVHSNDGKLRKNKKTPPNANRRGWPEHFMPDLDKPEAIGTMVQPKFFLTGLERPIGTTDAERREALADNLTKDNWFATAIVNRTWSELVGEGFYEPVDDLGPERLPTAPETIEKLSEAYKESGYNLKWLHKTIIATDAYQRESRPRRKANEKPMMANVAQPLRGDVLFDSILSVLNIEEKLIGRVGTGAPRGRRVTPRIVFNASFGFDPSLQREMVITTIPQTLAMMNTPGLNRHVRATRNTMLGKLLNKSKSDTDTVDELYLRTLSRLPSEEEQTAALAYRETMPNTNEPWEDLLWALLNSSEFSHRR